MLVNQSIANFNPDPAAPVGIDFVHPSEYFAGNRGAVTMSSNWINRLLDNQLDPRAMRPYIDGQGRSCITQLVRDPRTGKIVYNTDKDGRAILINGRPVPKERKILTNDSNATLPYDVWKQIDDTVMMAQKPTMKAAADLISAGLTYELDNGIAHTSIQSQTMSDISGATMSMDGLRQGESDRPVFATVNFPLPIIHKDFQFSLRDILASRNGSTPLDMATVAMSSQRVGEQVEQLVLGCGANSSFALPGQLLGQTSYTWNSSSVYGYMNWPSRITYSITLPTASGWIPQNTLDDVLAMIELVSNKQYTGPYRLYYGPKWTRYMGGDYNPNYPNVNLRSRLAQTPKINGVDQVDYIPDYSLLLVQQTQNVVQLVIGMRTTTLQWESHGGMQLNFKVMCLMLPRLRTDFYGSTGIVHGA